MLEKNFNWNVLACGAHNFHARKNVNWNVLVLSIPIDWSNKSLPHPQTSKSRKYERGYLGNYQR